MSIETRGERELLRALEQFAPELTKAMEQPNAEAAALVAADAKSTAEHGPFV